MHVFSLRAARNHNGNGLGSSLTSNNQNVLHKFIDADEVILWTLKVKALHICSTYILKYTVFVLFLRIMSFHSCNPDGNMMGERIASLRYSVSTLFCYSVNTLFSTFWIVRFSLNQRNRKHCFIMARTHTFDIIFVHYLRVHDGTKSTYTVNDF